MTLGTNDYPWRGQCSSDCGGNNPENCSYSYCNCTDGAVWRIRNDLGHPCVYWGNGGDFWWKAAAEGYRVDGTPAPRAIFSIEGGHLGTPSVGHTGIVLAVGPASAYGYDVPAGRILVEDWNSVAPCAHGIHTLPASAPGLHFIHIADAAAPAPAPPVAAVPIGSPDYHPAGSLWLREDPTWTGGGEWYYVTQTGEGEWEVADRLGQDRAALASIWGQIGQSLWPGAGSSVYVGSKITGPYGPGRAPNGWESVTTMPPPAQPPLPQGPPAPVSTGCPAGYTPQADGTCAAPASAAGGSSTAIAGLAILAAVAAVGWWEERRHPGELTGAARKLEGVALKAERRVRGAADG